MRRLGMGIMAAAMCVGLTAASQPSSLSNADRQALAKAVASPARSDTNRARDRYRNPAATLAFFGVRPRDTVVELVPGGGWYSEIIAPYVINGGGTYYAAAADRGLNGFRALSAKQPAPFAKARLANFPVRTASDVKVPDGSADVVLTFRNVHNWAMGEQPYASEAFRQIYAMLKPGGVLGIEEHRLPESADSAREKSSGYLKVSTVRRLAEQAGFRYAGSSEVNANKRDTADHPEGVWTLPPTLRLGDKDKAKYLAIGESDRMTLKFVKPR
ncbi:class I SAM-dependent methyltransferase [Sphingomonas rosea]|uniref:Class I SAM-dependent methyltransferase n=1 Tax=Sphingomonas rosea TaxID=335605 RepID=A0ABP7UAQ1_9SPHN